MLIVYHNADLDGICSGACLLTAYPEARIMGYDYNQPFDMDCVTPGEVVIFADVTLSFEKMHELAQRCCLMIIDHHKSFREAYLNHKKSGHDFYTYEYQEGVSACELCWKFAFPDTPMPEIVSLLGKYDTWRGHGTDEWENKTLPFQYGMRVMGFDPHRLAEFIRNPNCTIDDVVRDGNLVLKYQRQINEDIMSKFAFYAKIAYGDFLLNAICCCGVPFNSQSFESVYDEKVHHVMIPFAVRGDGTIKASFYTTHESIDCSKIAMRYGGGGHKSAAGANNIPSFEDLFVL